jgi:hypothetical protein
VARSVIADMQWYPVMMEHFGASAAPTVEACRALLEPCDLMLLFIAHRRGWVPTEKEGGNGSDSITALELAFARQRSIPVLVMMANDEWPGNKWENDDQDARQWVQQFRAGINQPADFFRWEDVGQAEAQRFPDFRARVRAILVRHQETLLEQHRPLAGGVDSFASALDGLRDAVLIPFIGHDVYEQGLLGRSALIKALGGAADAEPICLATAAEYRERSKGARAAFLTEFERIIVKASEASKPPPAYEILVSLIRTGHQPPLIVSATYDRMLEGLLEGADPPIPFTVVTHAMDATDGSLAGRLVVLRPGQGPQFCPADQTDLQGAGLIIYKPLGSPILNTALGAYLGPDQEVDTVMITESDHLTYLQRLENPATGLPASLLRTHFRRFRLLFLGYTLDAWQYRLLMRVLEILKVRTGRPDAALAGPPMAVRRPATNMEELAWRRLGADLIPQTGTEFANGVAQGLAVPGGAGP